MGGQPVEEPPVEASVAEPPQAQQENPRPQDGAKRVGRKKLQCYNFTVTVQ